MTSSQTPRKRRDRALLVVGLAGVAAAGLLASCGGEVSEGDAIDAGADTNYYGPVGNTALPRDTGGYDTLTDSVFNEDGPVGNTALPHDSAVADSDAEAPDTADARPDTYNPDGPVGNTALPFDSAIPDSDASDVTGDTTFGDDDGG